MPTRSGSGYPPLDVDATRNAVAAGRQVRVGILPTHQFPDGAAGKVRSVGFPGNDGPEFITVEVVVGGMKDVIPFAPADLSPIKRTQAAPELIAPVRRRASVKPAVSGSRAGVSSAASAPKPTTVAQAPASQPETLFATTPTPADPVHGSPVAAPATAGRRVARGKRQPVSITLATTEPDHTGWQIEVKVGNRVVVKPTQVHPARAWALVTDLGNPEVEHVVAQALTEHRQQAQQRADRLSRELAEAQAELANYPAF